MNRKREAAAGEGEEGGTSKHAKVVEVVARAAAGAKGEKEILKALVEVLGTLVLVNAAEVRSLCGTVYRTFLVDASAEPAVAVVAAGKMYNDKAKEMKERKMKLEKEGNAEEAGKVNLAGMGPPHMQVWAAP
eukprot:4218973-Lingulodinium_polyedra.AAC.1